MNTPIVELFTIPTFLSDIDWREQVVAQQCRYLERKCLKIRKSQPDVSIGTCSVKYGAAHPRNVIICPYRFLECGQIFLDCLHLLSLHEPGNELHRVAEIEIPGGSVDYFLVSVRQDRVVDFVGIELQSIDTTGSLWRDRQKFLHEVGLPIENEPITGTFGMNWKMTAKTTLVQLHHKIETFQALGKHLVLVLQDDLMLYMRREFNFNHIQDAKIGHAMHFHAYSLQQHTHDYRLQLTSRSSTDAQGIAESLGLQNNPNVELEVILDLLQSKLSAKTRLQI